MMYKKILTLFLILVMLLGSVLPVGAAEEEGEILEICGDARPVSVAQPGQQSKQPWDYIGETSLIEAMPATRDMAVRIPHNTKLFFFLRDSGNADCYFRIEIYGKGDTEPLAEVGDAFPGVYGLYSFEVNWSTSGFEPGSYRVVMYSATRSGESYIPVKGTESEVVVLLTDWTKPLESITLVDPDTRQPVSTLGLALNEIGYLEVVESPTYNTDNSAYRFNGIQNYIEIESYGGMISFVPKDFGWSTLEIVDTNNDFLYEIMIEVCVNSGGHINQEITRIAPREGAYEGVLLHTCPDCGITWLEIEEAYGAAMGRFVDLSSDQWYFEGVKSMVCRGLFNGVSTHHFRPDNSMTRAMLVTVLWRYAGEPEAGNSTFTDVPDGQWYSKAVSWAAEQGVVSGIGGGKFDPDGNVTREQMATILYRYAKLCGFETEYDADALASFPDKDSVSAYAAEPLAWAVSNGIITGTKVGSKTLLDPRGFATRAQLAVILTRYIDKYDPDPATLPIPNLDQALEHGSMGNSSWAFFSDGTLVIAGSSLPDFNNADGSVGRPWDHLVDQITRVEVREGIEHIGMYSFYKCTSLTEVQLPSTLRYIDNSAFSNCSSLEHIELPNGVRYLGYGVFRRCTALKEIVLPDTIYQKSFVYDHTFYAEGLFHGCTSLERVTLPAAMEYVPDDMFRNCTSLKEVNFGIGLRTIRDSAFANCTALEALVLPYSVRLIYDETFDTCTSLQAIVIPNPFATVSTSYKDSEGKPDYKAPFGNRETTTVFAFSGTRIEEIAIAEGYHFVPLESLIE